MPVLRALNAALILLSAATLSVPLSIGPEHQRVLERPTIRPPPILPVANATLSFWLREPNVHPAPTYGSEGPLTTDADVCIIGSGITGVSTAYHLSNAFKDAEKPVKAVVLEAREFCSGATGRNGGHLVAEQFENFKWLNGLFGREGALRGLELEDYTVEQITKILKEHDKVEAVDFVQGGRVILLYTKEQQENMRAEFEVAKAAGADVSRVQWLGKDDVQSRWGSPYPAILIPGNSLWPLKLVSVLFNLAQNASSSFDLALHTRTPVTSVTPSDAGSSERRWNVTTPRGSVSCSYVVHATNAYTARLLPWMHGPDGVVPTRGQVIAVRANTPHAIGSTGFVGNDGLEYWFPRQDNKAGENQLVILGGGRDASGGFEFYQADDSVVTPVVGKVLREFLPRVFPGRFDVREPEMEWTGVMGFTKTKEPFVGPVLDPAKPGSVEEYKGQFMSAGYSGHGMPRGFACAEAVAGMIKADMVGTKWDVPKWFPEHYLTTNRL